MWSRVVAALLLLVVAGCAGHAPEPAPVAFTKVDLPAGASPVVLTAAGDALLIGVRQDGQALVPGLLRRAADGTTTEIPLTAASPYGQLARWYSIAVDGDRIQAIGGERGGAHANVRWSAWTGTTAGITEKLQGFSVFGGWGAGELNDAAFTPAGPLLIGSWQSAKVGSDVAVWTADGDMWTRQSSAGTALESTADALGFPIAATASQQGVLVAGWQLVGGRQVPVVWRSTSGNTGWTAIPLPDAGQSGAAVAARCWDATCGVTGWVDGKLAIWKLTDGKPMRLPNTPAIAVGDRDRLAAPIDLDGRLTQVVGDGGHVKVLRSSDAHWTVLNLAGPTGAVTAVTKVGEALYLLAGSGEDTQTLWRADISAIR